MFITFIGSTYRRDVTGDAADWQRRIRSRNELAMLSYLNMAHLPFDRTEVRAEAGKWFWQP